MFLYLPNHARYGAVRNFIFQYATLFSGTVLYFPVRNFIFRKHLQLDALKVIDKRRILGYFYTRSWHEHEELTGQHEPITLDKKDLDAVDELIGRHFAPSLHKVLLHSKYRQQQLEVENQLLRHQLATLRALLPEPARHP